MREHGLIWDNITGAKRTSYLVARSLVGGTLKWAAPLFPLGFTDLTQGDLKKETSPGDLLL